MPVGPVYPLGVPSQAFSLGLDAFILDRLLGDLAPNFPRKKMIF
jgi:hypothetical protein